MAAKHYVEHRTTGLVERRELNQEEIETILSTASEVGTLYERMRVQVILESEEARTHPTAAQALALGSAMDPDAALDLLGSLPPEAGSATGSGQFAEMLAACEARKQAEGAAGSPQGNNHEDHR